MKRILFIFGAILNWGMLQGQISVYQCTPENSIITQQELISQEAEIFKPCVLFESNQPYNFNGTQQKTIRAHDEIHIKTDFHAGISGSGQLHLKAGTKTGEFEVFCMNYPDLLNVQRFKKFELGITLPEDIQQKIDNFIQKLPVPNEERLNPYMDWDIRVSFDFTHIQIPYTISVDGFYNKEYDAWMNEIPATLPAGKSLENYPMNEYTGFYNELGGYDEVPTQYPFLGRFSPPRTGKWNCTVNIHVSNSFTYTSDPFTFNVIPSDNPGILHNTDDQRAFELGNKRFYPVGANILWPQTYGIMNNDGVNDETLEVLLTDLDRNGDGSLDFLNEDWRQLRPIPILFDKYKNLIKKIADNGGNFVRLIMHPISLDIEFEELGNYTDRLYIAQEMDEILEYCESRNVYVDWNMMIHYVLQNNSYSVGWNNTLNGYQYAYHSLSGVGDDPIAFFTDSEAKAYYKQRIRYILARWGYSTNIAMFELFSEITGFPEYLTRTQDFNNWELEMASYIKERYNGATHMVQSGYTFKDDPAAFGTAYQSRELNNFAVNIYPGIKTFALKWIRHINKDLLDQPEECPHDELFSSCTENGNIETTIAFHKPLFIPEFDPGGDLVTVEKDYGNPETCDDEQIEMKRAMWQLPFSGAAGALSWSMYKNDITYPEFGKIKRFLDNMDGKGGWHPGAMELRDNRWAYRGDWADNMDHDRDPDDDEDVNNKADLMYMRSNDKNYAIGVITNKSYNLESVDGCFDRAVLSLDTNKRITNFDGLMESNEVGLRHTENWNLKLRGMKPGKYYITYFYPDEQSAPFHSDQGFGPTIPLIVNVPATYDQYIVLFMARRSGSDWMPELEDSIRLSAASKGLIEKSVEFELNHSEMKDQNFELVVYPIPSKDNVLIQNINRIENATFTILSMDGKTIESKVLDVNEALVDLSTYEKGVYILYFYQNDTLIKQTKIIKI